MLSECVTMNDFRLGICAPRQSHQAMISYRWVREKGCSTVQLYGLRTYGTVRYDKTIRLVRYRTTHC